MRSIFYLIFLLLIGCSLSTQSAEPKDFDFGVGRPIVAAHRAEHSAHSENSSEAIKASNQENIPLIEIDVRESADGELFLFHNRNVDPQTIYLPSQFLGKTFSLLSAEQIQSLVLPYGEKVPTFREALSQMSSEESSLLLDIKGGEEVRRKVIKTIRTSEIKGTYWFLCYDLSCISQVKDSCLAGAEVIARVNDELFLADALSIRPKIIQIDCDKGCAQVTSEIKSHDPSIQILATTLENSTDDEEHWQTYRDNGIDIILTNRPLDLKLFQTHSESSD